MFARILVPVDFTAKNLRAVEVAAAMAGLGHGRLVLLHVIEMIEGAEGAEIDEFYAQLEASARQKMAEMIQRVSAAGLEIEPAIVFGRRGPQIVQYADQHQMDLIVLSSHVVDPRRPGEGWATLSYQVSIACPCPVLLVKNALGPGEGS